jgi:alanine racemase
LKDNITAPVWAQINLDNIKYNLKNIKSRLSKDTKICGVVKANAYGHGSVEIAKLLQREKVDYLAVARFEEALELIQNYITLPILCLGYIPDESLKLAIENDIEITVYSLGMANSIDNIASKLGKIAKVHIKIDTGMTRIGFKPNQSSIEEIFKINNLKYIKIIGIYTHFATADEKDKKFTYIQYEKFKYIVSELENLNIHIPIKHVSNSATIIDCSELDCDMVRCGIILYGHYPSEEVKKSNLSLKPAMTLKTRVSNINEIQAGESIGYGQKYISKEKETIATLSIGYADGFSRLQTNPKAMIRGEVFDVVGRICMDQCMVRVDKNIDIKIGDEVILFGKEGITAENIAMNLGTINYEVLCMVQRRIERIYLEGNVIVQVRNYLVK